MEQGPFEYDKQPDDIEVLDMFMQKIQQLEPTSRELILRAIREKKMGIIKIKIDDANFKEVNLTPNKEDTQRVEEVMDALEELEPLLKPDETAEALGEEKDVLSASFEPYQ